MKQVIKNVSQTLARAGGVVTKVIDSPMGDMIIRTGANITVLAFTANANARTIKTSGSGSRKALFTKSLYGTGIVCFTFMQYNIFKDFVDASTEVNDTELKTVRKMYNIKNAE